MLRRLQLLALILPALAWAQAPKAQLVQCRRIWDRSPHNAYTDLIHHNGRWFCVFREGTLPTSPDGALCVLTSSEGENWRQAALLGWPSGGLREPKLSASPDGRMVLSAVAAARGEAPVSVAWSSINGRDWSAPQVIGDPGEILGRIAWRLGRAYSMASGASGPAPLRLYSAGESLRFAVYSSAVESAGQPADGSLVFLDDGSAICLLSRDGASPSAQLGLSRSPYRGWSWNDLGKTIAGPSLIRLPDGRFVAGARVIDETVRTSLLWLDPGSGTLSEFFALPSSGDTGYPGLAFRDGLLWVSYYSSHEGKAAIYLAQVKLPPPDDGRKPPKRLTF